MLKKCIIISAFMFCSVAASAAEKGTRFWNLTSATIEKLYMAPAGTGNFGSNQCENDRDGTVDHDERLKITGISSGNYDIKIAYAAGKVCLAKNIAVKEGGVFELKDADLSCNK